jgi:hypothetical protein
VDTNDVGLRSMHGSNRAREGSKVRGGGAVVAGGAALLL